jgi:pSer/pThr/pTyr-binding forkhead associated (FHA) protein
VTRSTPRVPAPPVTPPRLESFPIEVRQPLRGGCVVVSGACARKLTAGAILVGREASCDIVLPDALVSRVHARLSVDPAGVLLHDLHSMNGIYVNGVRIGSEHDLRDGDRILVGTRELSVFAHDTLDGGTRTAPPALVRGRRAEPFDATERADVFAVIGPFVKRELRDGDPISAERILADAFTTLLGGARFSLAVPEDTRETSSLLALVVAQATRRAEWIDRVIELHLRTRCTMSQDVVEALYQASQVAKSFNVTLLEYYIELLERTEDMASPSETSRVERLLAIAQTTGPG